MSGNGTLWLVMMLKTNVQDTFKIMQFRHVDHNLKINASHVYSLIWCSEVYIEVVSGGKWCRISDLNARIFL